MVWMMIILGIVLILLCWVFAVIISTISVKIENLTLSSLENRNKGKYKVVIRWKIFNKVPVLGFTIRASTLRTLYEKQKLKMTTWEEVKKIGGLEEIKKISKTLAIRISYLKLQLEIGIEDAMITSLLVGILGGGISILLPKIASYPITEKNYYYEINPIYHKNCYKMDLTCIIQVKMVHIIAVIVMVLKKKGDKKHERTSNRRAYEYGYE